MYFVKSSVLRLIDSGSKSRSEGIDCFSHALAWQVKQKLRLNLSANARQFINLKSLLATLCLLENVILVAVIPIHPEGIRFIIGSGAVVILLDTSTNHIELGRPS